MNAILEVKKLLGIQQSKESIVTKLLQNNFITPAEAVILLKGDINLHVQKIELSSGSKIVNGDDNETVNY